MSQENSGEKKQEVKKVKIEIKGRKRITLAEVDRSAKVVRPLDPNWECFVFGFNEVSFIE